ncbi:MAG: 3-deoxy-D-manno-octulosonic acid transferase [Gammaproteobacteria bacterium]
MRWLYSLAWYVALPGIAVFLLFRPQWRRGWRDRLGLSSVRARRGIWVHAASVGEIQAALPLVESLRMRYPDHALTVTAFTPTGREHALRNVPNGVDCALLPFDFPGAVTRFLERLRPRIAIVVETELWPNLFAECALTRVPLLMASARITDDAVRAYRRWPKLIARTLAIPDVITVQTDADADRLLSLGADPTRVTVGGNLKFDFALPDGLVARAERLREQVAAGRPVWIAASTHDGEDAPVLEAHRAVLATSPDTMLVLAPRHPGRADAVAALVAREGLTLARRSARAPIDAPQVYLLDTLGELAAFYGIADAAFVGGTLVPVGGHNLLEPAAFGVPLLCGPHIDSVTAMHALFDDADAVETVFDAAGLGAAVARYLTDDALRVRRGAAARAVLEQNRGAVARVMHLVEGILP